MSSASRTRTWTGLIERRHLARQPLAHVLDIGVERSEQRPYVLDVLVQRIRRAMNTLYLGNESRPQRLELGIRTGEGSAHCVHVLAQGSEGAAKPGYLLMQRSHRRRNGYPGVSHPVDVVKRPEEKPWGKGSCSSNAFAYFPAATLRSMSACERARRARRMLLPVLL
jgi:hypothetical protein